MTDIITTQATATAAASGAAATERFRTRQSEDAPAADTKRVDTLATELITAVHDIVRRHQVTYAEYDVLKSWLIQVGEDGEWPLFLDVWVEHVIEEVASENRAEQQGHHRGPLLRPRRPALPRRRDPAHA